MDSVHLILASKSPRRQEILQLCGEPFLVAAANVDEDGIEVSVKRTCKDQEFNLMASRIVMELAKAKARQVLNKYPEAIVIGADTIVIIDESILGKPSTEEDAFAMLRKLSGRRHHVLTGVSILSREREETFYTSAGVHFYPWYPEGEDLARRYIDTGSPLDKAGAYGIQDMGALFVKSIEGDYYTVMGLPVAEVYRRLKNFGFRNKTGGLSDP